MKQKTPVDLQRRRTLKVAGAIGGAIATAPVASFAGSSVTESQHPAEITSTDAPLDEFVVEVQHQWMSNDIALVIRNRGEQAATITHITPLTIELARGTLNVGDLLKDGPVTVAAGERLVVPLTHRKGGLYHSQVIAGGGHFDRSLQKQLRERMTIITDHNALAAVTVAHGPRIV
jgi:hypothetical protein